MKSGKDIFRDFFQRNADDLLALSQDFLAHKDENISLTRPFLGRYNLEATKMEELLDAYGAHKNESWYPFRSQVAAAKRFSGVGYDLLHILYSAPAYQLLSIERDLYNDTNEVINSMHEVISQVSKKLLKSARDCGLSIRTSINGVFFEENLPPGCLINDRALRDVQSPGKTVAHLSTAFLNLSEEGDILSIFERSNAHEYASCFPDVISEEKLRLLENRFHNLQSLYDTHISDSNIESKDTNLPILRGHISIIYHLLEVATSLAHFFERHILDKPTEEIKDLPIDSETLLDILMNYAIAFSHIYLQSAKKLCHTMLKEYAEQGRIEVPVPPYRGFHVRPSTLISKIIHHYGSEVLMELNGKVYDAARPLELFRVNEEINAQKRKVIAAKIDTLQHVKDIKPESLEEMKTALRGIILDLLERRELILYESNFSFDELTMIEGETLAEFAKRGIAHCLALGRIDIETDITVAFIGDKRVLRDIKILAENGYGEDKYGNNIMLPPELSYLRR